MKPSTPLSKEILRLIKPQEKDLGEFSVRRALPAVGQKMVGPWIFFDHMGPADFSPGSGINVRPHPHINLATVTYLFEGEIFHRDSLGNAQAIQPGAVNLMVAGRGIVHSERTSPEKLNSGQRLHGLQLWLALPEAHEEMEADFIHYDASELPCTHIDGVELRVIMGSAHGLNSPVKTFAGTLYVEAHLQSGQTLTLADSEERAIYIASGAARINNVDLPEHTMAILSAEKNVQLEAKENTRMALIGGEKLGERFIEWNFVSSRKERIEQAKDQWRAQNFEKIPGDDEEYIPLPE